MYFAENSNEPLVLDGVKSVLETLRFQPTTDAEAYSMSNQYLQTLEAMYQASNQLEETDETRSLRTWIMR